MSRRVLVSRWQRVARENAHILRNVRIETPPASRKDVIQLGRIALGSKAREKDDAEVMHEVLFSIACGAMTKVIEAGWTPQPSPSLETDLMRGDERIAPIRLIFQIGHGETPAEEWAAFCKKEGLSGPLAS